MSVSPSEKEIEEELHAIHMSRMRQEQSKQQLEEFRQKLRQMKDTLKRIESRTDPETASDMKEVCLFTIFQCNQHIIH